MLTNYGIPNLFDFHTLPRNITRSAIQVILMQNGREKEKRPKFSANCVLEFLR